MQRSIRFNANSARAGAILTSGTSSRAASFQGSCSICEVPMEAGHQIAVLASLSLPVGVLIKCLSSPDLHGRGQQDTTRQKASKETTPFFDPPPGSLIPACFLLRDPSLFWWLAVLYSLKLLISLNIKDLLRTPQRTPAGHHAVLPLPRFSARPKVTCNRFRKAIR